jgi:hypothetical protein
LQQIRVEAELHRQKLTTHFRGQDKRTTFAPDSVTLQTEAGRLLQTRRTPRSSFSGQVLNSPWDELHVAYFNSYALWTYLTAPFLYTFPGFETEELPAWHEDGETWRPPRVFQTQASTSRTSFAITTLCWSDMGLPPVQDAKTLQSNTAGPMRIVVPSQTVSPHLRLIEA